MKINIKKILLFAPCIILITTGPAFPLSTITLGCTKISCPSDTTTCITMTDAMSYCTSLSSTKECYQDSSGNCYLIQNCTACKAPYSLTASPICRNTLAPTYQTCGCTCSGCASETLWSDADNAGYERKASRSCSCAGTTAQCITSYEYRCAAGYYGSSTDGQTGCTRCPISGSSYGTTASGGATDITECYLTDGSSFGDAAGTGIIEGGSCQYSRLTQVII